MTFVSDLSRFGLSAAVCCVLACAATAADPATARAELAQEQAAAETQRLGEQFDVLTHNQETINARLAKLESSLGEVADLKAEVAALKTDNAALRKDLEAQRQQVVDELSKKLSTMPSSTGTSVGASRASSSVSRHAVSRSSTKAAADNKPSDGASSSGAAESGYEHVVESGQTLSSIAAGYGTTVKAIKDANHLKSNVLRVGQKLFIPDTGKK